MFGFYAFCAFNFVKCQKFANFKSPKFFPMNYDVFISYSRKDTIIADRICEAFDKVGIVYFIDRQGIGGGLEFPKVLAENIINSKLFLLLASENSYNSKFTTSEIIFAFNKKPKNCIIPYIIDQSSLPLDLEFVFAGVNWRNIDNHPIEPTLVADVLKLLQREAEVKPEPISTKSYKVGDYYDDGRKQGVVFDISSDGKHGKILSLWESKDVMWSSEKGTTLGVADAHNGDNNLQVVKNVENWRLKYPAFASCADAGSGWYLPAIEELKLFVLNERVRDAVNVTLKDKGQKLPKVAWWKLMTDYWSSTEKDANEVWTADVSSGGSVGQDKDNYSRVRPVAKF